jgi:hypothetical protein
MRLSNPLEDLCGENNHRRHWQWRYLDLDLVQLHTRISTHTQESGEEEEERRVSGQSREKENEPFEDSLWSNKGETKHGSLQPRQRELSLSLG